MRRWTPKTTTIRPCRRRYSRGALRLLIAQRALYAKAKRWTYLRWIGFSVMGIVAPPLAVFFPKAAVVVGAVAGVWIFLSRNIFKAFEGKLAAQGAAVQEDFDRLVFDMPPLATRVPRPTLKMSPSSLARIQRCWTAPSRAVSWAGTRWIAAPQERCAWL